jgi:hypothetical protein
MGQAADRHDRAAVTVAAAAGTQWDAAAGGSLGTTASRATVLDTSCPGELARFLAWLDEPRASTRARTHQSSLIATRWNAGPTYVVYGLARR